MIKTFIKNSKRFDVSKIVSYSKVKNALSAQITSSLKASNINTSPCVLIPEHNGDIKIVHTDHSLNAARDNSSRAFFVGVNNFSMENKVLKEKPNFKNLAIVSLVFAAGLLANDQCMAIAAGDIMTIPMQAVDGMLSGGFMLIAVGGACIGACVMGILKQNAPQALTAAGIGGLAYLLKEWVHANFAMII